MSDKAVVHQVFVSSLSPTTISDPLPISTLTMASRKQGASKKKARIQLPEDTVLEGNCLLIHYELDDDYNSILGRY